MTRQQGSTHASKWLFMENGQATVRNVHRIEVQSREGKLFSLTGERLPDFVVLTTGRSQQGDSIAQILDRPNRTVSRPLPAPKPWPEWRDMLHVVIGLATVGALNFIVSVANAAF